MSFNDPAQQSILRLRPFLLYWNARTFAGIAAQMVGVAVGWQIYSLTGNPFDLGLVGLFQFLPATVLILVAGQVADRYDRRPDCTVCRSSNASPPQRSPMPRLPDRSARA